MTKRLWMALALCVGVTAAAVAAPGAPAAPGKATVGEFAVKVARALGYDAADAGAAAGALKTRGVTFAADFSATLTEGEAARIMADLGLAVVPPVNPGAAVSPVRAGSLAAAIPPSVMTEGRTTLEGDVTECLASQNRGECNNCCKAATGLTGQFCGRFCHSNVPPVSPVDPQP